LEEIEYRGALRAAAGTPQEVWQREMDREQIEAGRRYEKEELDERKIESEIAENESDVRAADALAQYRRAGGAAGYKEEKNTTYADAIKLIDGQIRQLDDILSDPDASAEDKTYARTQRRQLFDQREVLVNESFNELGLPMSEFGVGGSNEPPPPPPAPPIIPYFDRINRATAEGGYGAGLGEAYKSFAPAGRSLMEMLRAVSYQPPVQQISPGNNVILNRMGPEQIAKMQMMGLLQNVGNQQPQPSALSVLFNSKLQNPSIAAPY
jgi:hypothetical protein